MNNFIELLSENSNLNITINAGQLMAVIDYCIAKTRSEFEQHKSDEKAETFPSPKQVCEILGVNPSTLFRWHKKGYLCHIEVGGKRRYKMSDINVILNGGEKK